MIKNKFKLKSFEDNKQTFEAASVFSGKVNKKWKNTKCVVSRIVAAGSLS